MSNTQWRRWRMSATLIGKIGEVLGVAKGSDHPMIRDPVELVQAGVVQAKAGGHVLNQSKGVFQQPPDGAAVGDADRPLPRMPISELLQKFPRPLKELQGAFPLRDHKAGPVGFEGDVGVEMPCLNFRNRQSFKDAEVFFPEPGVELDFVAGVAGDGLDGAAGATKVTAVKVVKRDLPEALCNGLNLGAACVREFAVAVALVALFDVPAGFAVADEPDFGVEHSGFRKEWVKVFSFARSLGEGKARVGGFPFSACAGSVP